MNPQKRRTIGKYRVAEDHYCQGVKQRTSSLSGKEGRGEKGGKEEEGLNFSKKKRKNYKYLLPSGPVLHLQVG